MSSCYMDFNNVLWSREMLLSFSDRLQLTSVTLNFPGVVRQSDAAVVRFQSIF